jgi:hypothetical protein
MIDTWREQFELHAGIPPLAPFGLVQVWKYIFAQQGEEYGIQPWNGTVKHFEILNLCFEFLMCVLIKLSVEKW